jgi:hypothetical protein
MNISINDLKTERQWRSATGYDKQRFTNLLNLFKREYLITFGTTLAERRSDSPKESPLTLICNRGCLLSRLQRDPQQREADTRRNTIRSTKTASMYEFCLIFRSIHP